MEERRIDKATSDKISFMTYIMPAFAETYKMNVQSELKIGLSQRRKKIYVSYVPMCLKIKIYVA